MRCLTLLFLMLPFYSIADEGLLLSGRIQASDSQAFYAPKTDNWRVQVQWMLPEGEVAKKGDLVVVFDSGSILSTIEQSESSLLVAEDELHRVRSEAKQKLLEAEHLLKRNELLLEKSKIDAGIGQAFISQFDYGKNQLNYEKALVELLKAKENLKQVKLSNSVNIKKKELTIEKHQYKLSYNQDKLSKMSLPAQRTGPVVYGKHPWNGEKVFVGMTAQPSWKIAEIPAAKGLYVEAWLHEADHQKITLNQKGKLVFDAYPKESFSTELLIIASQPEERKEWGEDVYYRLKFSLADKSSFKVLPGMSVQIELEGVGE